MYKKLIKWAGVTVILMFILHTLANTFYWYTSIFGFDKVMHTLGGIFLALLAGALLNAKRMPDHTRHLFVTLLLFVFIVGLAWEYYEYLVQYIFKSIHLADVPDSIGDLIFDMVGGIIGSYFVILIKRRYNKDL